MTTRTSPPGNDQIEHHVNGDDGACRIDLGHDVAEAHRGEHGDGEGQPRDQGDGLVERSGVISDIVTYTSARMSTRAGRAVPRVSMARSWGNGASTMRRT